MKKKTVKKAPKKSGATKRKLPPALAAFAAAVKAGKVKRNAKGQIIGKK